MKRKWQFILSILFGTAGIYFSAFAFIINSLANSDSASSLSAAACSGDLNDDTVINDSDLTLMVDTILKGNPQSLCTDLNEDGKTNVLDLQVLVNRILNPTTGNTYYVSTTGSDANDGSFEHPWATIKYAWENSSRGDTVFVRGGTYTEGRTIWLVGGNGTANQFWTLKAYPGETPVFTGAKFIADSDYIRIQGMHMTGTSKMQAVCWEGMHEHIEFLDNVFTGDSPAIDFIGNYILVQGNTFDIPNGQYYAIYAMHGSNNIIRNNDIRNMPKYAIHVYDEDKYDSDPDPKILNLLIENNRISNTQDSAAIIISAGESNNLGIEINGVIIRNNVITNTAGEGDGITIRYDGIIRNVQILNNVIYGNTDEGISISATNVDDVTIKNNILSSNATAQISITSSLSHLIISHNLYHNPTSIGAGASDDHPVFGDPLFVNPSSGDFHLRVNSPAIDAGIDVGLPYVGVAPDIGAYEYGQ